MAEITPSLFAFHNITFNLGNLIKYALRDFGLRVRAFTNFSFIYEKDSINLTFEHDYGIMWPKILDASFSEFFENSFNLKTTSGVSESILTMKLAR